MQITDIAPQKKYKNRLNVYIDGEFSFGIDEFDAFKLKLKIGKEITEEELFSIKENVIFSKAKEYALLLVTKGFYTEKGVRSKLSDRLYDDETINKVICFLKEYKFIDDLEYAKSYSKECLYIKKYGRKKIKMMLYEKGIASDLIEEVMAEFDFDEAEEDNLSELIEKKLGGNFDFKNVMKTKRYFVSRGYDYNVIDKALKKITESFDEF